MRRYHLVVGSLICAWFAGCGGGGGSPSPDTAAARVVPGTAKFHVDVTTGQVTVSAPTPGSSRAVMLGGSVNFHSSTLLDQPGNTGLRILNVKVTNRWVQDLGRQPDGRVTGLRVLFSPFQAAGSFADLRPRVTVSALAGNGLDEHREGAYSDAAFRAPTGVAVAPDGTIYLTDKVANRVRQLRGGFAGTLAGSGAGGGTDGVGTGATFQFPAGIAYNPADGSLVVTESTGRRIRRVTPDGRVTRIAGTGAIGTLNGPGTTATFASPQGVAVDGNGTIYVADAGSHQIRRIVRTGADPAQPASYLVTLLAGGVVAGLADGVGSAARFNGPTGIAILGGRLYVADEQNDRVRLVTTDGAVATVAGGGSAGRLDGDGASAIFVEPHGIAALDGTLLVTESRGRRLRQLRLRADGTASPASPSSWLVQTLVGSITDAVSNTISFFLDGDGTVAQLGEPLHVAATPAGELLVADAAFHRLRRVSTPNGLFPVTVPGGATGAAQVRLANGDGLVPSSILGTNLPFIAYPGVLAPGATTGAQPWVFAVPAGVTAFEFMVTLEADTAVPAPPEAVLNLGTTVLGSPDVRVRTLTGGEPGYLDGSLESARFVELQQVAGDALGNFYVADPGSDTIRCIGADGRVTTIAGRPNAGGVTSGDGAGNAVTFNDPFGVAAAPDGSAVYFTEFGTAKVRGVFFTGTDRANPAHWTVVTLIGLVGAGANDGTGATARCFQPAGIVRDTSGNLYFTEGGNRVRLLRHTGGDPHLAANWSVSLVAGDNRAISGAAGDANGTGFVARFRTPLGICVDAAGTLYVTESTGHRVRRITNPGGIAVGTVSTIPNGGTVGPFVGAGEGLLDGGTIAARFSAPRGIAVDDAGYLYVADTGNDRIRRVSPSGEVATIAGGGTPVFPGGGGFLRQVFGIVDGTGETASFLDPKGIAIDPSGNLLVTDAQTVRLIQRTITSPTP